MNRKQFLQQLGGYVSIASISGSSVLRLAASPVEAAESAVDGQQKIRAVLRETMKTDFAKINTDWDGSIRMEALLHFAAQGDRNALSYARQWLSYHIEHDGKLSDADYYKQYEGPRVRIVRGDPLTFVLYSANLGVAFPAYLLHRQTGDEQARKVCVEVANTILEVTSRDRFGMLSDDEDHYKNWQYAIPDTTYWATRACAIAAELSEEPGVAALYRQQAIFQLEQGIKYFFDPSVNLVRTGLFNGKPGTTYWCRSQGWLLWAIGGLLRHLPMTHPKFAEFSAVLARIVEGVAHVQSQRGALHVLVNDPSTPEEVTGIAMVLCIVREAMRKGWISEDFSSLCEKGWKFILESIDANGAVHHAYTGWAATAEERQTQLMDMNFRGYVPGIVLMAASAMSGDLT